MTPSIASRLIVAVGIALGLGVSLAGGLIGVRAVGKARRARRVTWIGRPALFAMPRGLSSEEIEAVRRATVQAGLSTYGEVVRHVADQWVRRDYERVGRLADLGFFHPWYVRRADLVLERLDGQLVRIEAESGEVGRWD